MSLLMKTFFNLFKLLGLLVIYFLISNMAVETIIIMLQYIFLVIYFRL